jgi:hypothetical protein
LANWAKDLPLILYENENIIIQCGRLMKTGIAEKCVIPVFFKSISQQKNPSVHDV